MKIECDRSQLLDALYEVYKLGVWADGTAEMIEIFLTELKERGGEVDEGDDLS